ncbi:MAG: type VI secretion system baseplate subunit TssE [Planctomycetes bacterium]|nr:type VI secretion system baseplate subunit TssE [Planctomycetota bacterium]
MGREQSLLERIAARAEASRGRQEVTATEDLDAVMDSVREHLIQLLNARHGMSEALPDYGLPALTDLMAGSDDYGVKVLESIKTTVEKYEPRLRRVRVTRVAGEEQRQVLSFRVDATLVSESGEHRVWYETMVTGIGEFDVSA